jgi:hypothetical protein
MKYNGLLHILIGFTGMAAAGAAFGLLDEWDRELIAQIVDVRIRVDQASRIIADRERIELDYEALFSGAVVDAQDAAAAFRMIEEIARKYKLVLTDIRRGDTRGDLGENRFELTLEGPEEAYIGFLHDLENSSLLFTVRQLTLTPDKESGLLRGKAVIVHIPL